MTLSEFFKKLFSRRLWGNCLGMAITGCALVVGALFFLHYYTRHGEEITVPDLRGQDAEAAMLKLRALGLQAEVGDTGYVKALPGNVVLEQSIAQGERVKPGRILLLTVNSDGSPSIALPDVADNSSRREAETKLKALGFKLTQPEYVDGERDWVYGIKVKGRNMSAGARVSIESPVTLIIGDGHTEEEFNGNDSLDYLFFGDENLSDSLGGEDVGYEEEPASHAGASATAPTHPENP